MAGLEALASTIYHEKQQPGSMLCAQHALNSLLQGNYLTAPDLSAIANELDSLEQSVQDEQHGESANMDDTGFFSVQVLEHALKVWGLNLVRWRSEEMKPYHTYPHTQLAFILNLEQHWFTLRRFGPAQPNIENDPGDGHWFNLNSFLKAPEWVGKLYLGMVLQQAETEGYSVFAVTQADPEAPLALPRTLADEIASTLPEPSSAAAASSSTSFQRTMTSASSPSTSQAQQAPGQERFDEEDYELQAALQASLMTSQAMDVDEDEDEDGEEPPPLSRRTIPLPTSSQSQSPNYSDIASGAQTPHAGSMEEDEELDPVAASMARNQRLLEQMQREQAYAHREIWSEAELSPEETGALEQRREARRREEEEEEEQLRRAIEESERMARKYESKQAKDGDQDSDSDDDMEPQPTTSSTTTTANLGSSSHYSADRVYDDEDAELQAALKASLEGLPPDFQHPDVEVEEAVRPSSNPTTSLTQPTLAPPMQSKDREDNESIASTETSITENAPEPEEQLSVDEIRRRRLARFGL